LLTIDMLMEPLADCVQNLILIEKWNKRILQLYKKRRLSRQSDMWKYADGKTNHGNEWRRWRFRIFPRQQPADANCVEKVISMG